MLKKTITYTDFNDEEVTEELFFHLNKAELIELEMSHDGGLSEALQRIINAQDGKGIVAEFKKIILGAYGKKSADGKRFVKNAQIREEFESSEAYSELFMELVTDTDAAIAFINGIVPQGLAQDAAKMAAIPAAPEAPSATVTKLPPPVGETPQYETITSKEIDAMPEGEDKDRLYARIGKGEVKIVG